MLTDVFLPVVLLLVLLSVCQCQVTVQFVDTAIQAEEGSQFELQIRRLGAISQILNVIVNVSNVDNDFVGSSQVGSFAPGGLELTDVTSVTFTVNDDTEPEIEEDYIFHLYVIGEGATVIVPNVATVSILANDDAYGFFSFSDTAQRFVDEGTMTTVIAVKVKRERGLYGRVIVSYVVNSTDIDAIPGQDVAPEKGSLTFEPDEQSALLQIQIRADVIPENAEDFYVVLTGASQGARVDTTPYHITIRANDAPIRLQQKK